MRANCHDKIRYNFAMRRGKSSSGRWVLAEPNRVLPKLGQKTCFSLKNVILLRCGCRLTVGSRGLKNRLRSPSGQRSKGLTPDWLNGPKEEGKRASTPGSRARRTRIWGRYLPSAGPTGLPAGRPPAQMASNVVFLAPPNVPSRIFLPFLPTIGLIDRPCTGLPIGRAYQKWASGNCSKIDYCCEPF